VESSVVLAGGADLSEVRAITFDVFGTTFDWWSGVVAQVDDLAKKIGLELDVVAATDHWREEFFLALDSVRNGRREFAYLDVLHAECLERVLVRADVADRVDDETRRHLVRVWHRLPAWNDVAGGLRRLQDKFTLAALSNGGFALTTALVKNAGLPFDCILSAQNARHYKPDIEVYNTAAELLDLEPRQVMMVAAHGWDIAGARAAGFRTAYVKRPRESGPHKAPENPDSVACDLVVGDFGELADILGC
jgi:2-haloacid dehalogenase